MLENSWIIKFVNNLGKDVGGHCDFDAKIIRICRGLEEYDELRIIIHELLHASDYYKDEMWVDNVSRDIADVLYKKMKWTKQKKNENNKG